MVRRILEVAGTFQGGSGGEQVDWMNITDHLYLNKNGTKYEISVGQDASGNDVVTVTPVGG